MQNEYSKFLSFCHFCKRCHVRCHIIGFKTSIWCSILTHIFFWLNTKNNADPYIITPPNLSSTRKCDNEPQGTLISWFGPILFLPHQSNVIDHSWPLAIDHICKNKNYVYMCIKKTSVKLSMPSHTLLGKSKCISLIFVFIHFLLQVSVTQIQQSLSRVNISAAFSMYINCFCHQRS